MPTYAYRCTKCDNAFDHYQSFSDEPLTECPSCGGPLRKVYGSIGVTFNGSGFYRTDARAASSSSTPASSSGTSSAPSTPSPAPASSPSASSGSAKK